MRRKHLKPVSRLSAWAPPLVLAAVLAGCGSAVQNPVSGRSERSAMSETAEVEEGAKAHAEVLQEYTPLANPALQAYVNGIGQKLAAQSHRANLKWTFTVLDSPEVNAFALPGGYVYITRGIMAYLDSEADLAGVLGHEIGHVTARHGAQRSTRGQTAGLGVLLASVGGLILEARGVAGAAQAASQLSQAVAAGNIAKYGREQELQADQLGAEYLARVRYNPTNMVDVIQVLKDQERYAADAAKAAGKPVPAGPGWLASHPSSDQRLADIRGTATRLAATRAAGAWEDDGRLRYLRAMEGVNFGDSREGGVVRGRQFFHEPMNIAMTAPQGWHIQNSADHVAVMSDNGSAALVMQLVPPKAGTDHEAILRQALGATEGRIERLTLGSSLPATHFAGQRRDSKGQVSALEATLVTGPAPQNQVFLLQWHAKDAATLQQARAGLREAELTFRALTPADRAAAKPWQLRLAPLPAGGFAQLVRNSPLSERHLRLLNNAYGAEGTPNDPRPGQLVKTVVTE